MSLYKDNKKQYNHNSSIWWWLLPSTLIFNQRPIPKLALKSFQRSLLRVPNPSKISLSDLDLDWFYWTSLVTKPSIPNWNGNLGFYLQNLQTKIKHKRQPQFIDVITKLESTTQIRSIVTIVNVVMWWRIWRRWMMMVCCVSLQELKMTLLKILSWFSLEFVSKKSHSLIFA
jgi:hypothetical protein